MQSSQPQPNQQLGPSTSQQVSPSTTVDPPTGTKTKNNSRNRNNRHRNQTHQSTHRSQQPLHPTQTNQSYYPQHPPPQDQQHRPNFRNRQTPPHLNQSINNPDSNLSHNLSNQPGSQKHNRNHRAKRFGSKLTDLDHQGSNEASTASTPTQPIDLSSLSLSARLIVELSSSTYDCSICISPIAPYHPIYHCPNCYAIFHLKCSTKWAACSITDTSSKATLLRDRDRIPCSEEALKGEWRCPGCQDRHIGQDSIPNKYTCWCAKLENPSSRNNNQHLAGRPRSKIPHSCGKRCGKVSAQGCTHGCTEECHPGSCPPCSAVIKANCHCRKTELSIRCSQLYTNSPHLEPVNPELLSCGQTCNHQLSCGLHSCKQVCHPEECEECTVIRQKSCYCRAVVLSDQNCSDQVSQHQHLLSSQPVPEKLGCVSQDGLTWLGEFACNDPCAWKYDCGIHSCESTCHPHLVSTPSPCPFSPTLVKTCPCGTTPSVGRQACSDPISTCGNPCGQLIPSCGHVCPNICHLGPCGPCKSLVTTICNCGKDRIVRHCLELEQLKEAAILENELKIPSERKDIETVKLAAMEYRCERRCRVLRHCGKHTCHRRCCPLSFLENVHHTGSKKKKTQSARHNEDEDPLGLHHCDLKCNKKLSCGLHSCQLQDHKGPCPSCLQSSFDELFCHCGATVIQPPVPCGTKIDCHAPCQRPPPSCGHPKPSHTCHEEPDCPPCPYLTEKACQCHRKKLVKNVRCSQPKVTCGSTCDNLLTCGAHRCSRQCHPPGQCESCDGECLKPRKHCGHGCQQKCHAPSACRTEEPCEATINIQCACGRITQHIKCASCDARPEGNEERRLKCNDDCILFQRNMAVANALHITKPLPGESQSVSAIEWSSRLLNFFGTHALFAKAIEKQLAGFLKSELSTKLGSSKNSLIISTFSKLKQAFLLEFVAYYQIKADSLGEEPRFTVKLVKDSSSCLPDPLLSAAHANYPDSNKPSTNQDKPGSFSTLGTTLLRLPGISKLTPSAIGERDLSVACSPNQILAILFEDVFGHDHQSLAKLIESALDLKDMNPKANRIKFRLNWINDEDVLFRVTSASSSLLAGTKTDLEELQMIQEYLMVSFSQTELEQHSISGRKKFYKSIALVKVHLLGDLHNNDEGEKAGLKIKKIEPITTSAVNEDSHSGWKSSASTKKLHSKPLIHSQYHQKQALTNRFSSLLLSTPTSDNHASTVLHQSSSTSTAVGHFSGGVISGGFNRPPIAVLAPIASTSHSLGVHGHSGTSSKHKAEEEDVVDDWETTV